MFYIPDTHEWRTFLKCYRNLPVLWKPNVKVSRGKKSRDAAWRFLLKRYKRIDPSADIRTLQKRIMNIRTCYRRELKKVAHYEKLGSEYIPNLWYFDILKYFIECEDAKVPQRLLEVRDEDACDEIAAIDGNLQSSPNNATTFNKEGTSRDNVQHYSTDNSKPKFEEFKEDFSVYAESWATSYRKLSTIQKLYAKRAIEEVLVYGELDLLTFDSVKPLSKTVLERTRTMSCSSLSDHNDDPSQTNATNEDEVESGEGSELMPEI